ncbi:MAG TPA: hypothetical protein VFY43_05120 [Candidatus Limnocylindria bacterium]|nr:hypothetical protein [Candidatus Limnocylindria bacterium]
MALLVVGLIACSPAASPGSSEPSDAANPEDAGATLVEDACADAAFASCRTTMTAALDMFAGKLVVVCEYDDGQGGVQVIERREDADGACSPGTSSSETPPPGASSVAPGRVVAIVQIPE